MAETHFRHRLAYARHLVVTGGLTPTLIPAEGTMARTVDLAKQGVGIGLEFGPTALERLVSVAELSEQSVYERHSLRRESDGVGFTLLNPPLRMGAYHAIEITWDDSPVDPARWTVSLGGAAPRTGSSVDRSNPVTFPVGVRSKFHLEISENVSGGHRVRLSFHNVAIPPKVWMDFHERVGD